jgi:hypothetical protein
MVRSGGGVVGSASLFWWFFGLSSYPHRLDEWGKEIKVKLKCSK